VRGRAAARSADCTGRPLRVGIHTGDVVYDRDGVFGDGVNVASRIQSLAEPGSVIVSAKVFDEIRNQRGLDAISLGEFDLKNVRRPMQFFALVAEGLVLPRAGDRAQRARSPGRIAAGGPAGHGEDRIGRACGVPEGPARIQPVDAVMASYGQMPAAEAYAEAEQASLRAVELDPEDGSAHSTLGLVRLFADWDFDGAWAECQKALGMSPGSAQVRHAWAVHLLALGQAVRAIDEMEIAVQLDPLSPLRRSATRLRPRAGSHR